MKEFIEVKFTGVTEEINALLIAELFDLGYDGFLDEGDQLITYMEQSQFDEAIIAEWANHFSIHYTLGKIAEQNWNANWEQSFEPVVIGNKLAIRASFHQPTQGVEREIVITPKMSFGTGHHATTSLMVKNMFDLSFKHKTVLDFGTGTGILAILAEMLGASSLLAIDNDEWSMDNARENVKANGCFNIRLELNDRLPEGKQYDVILANINRHILLEHADSLIGSLADGGSLFLSGILTEDREIIVSCFGEAFGEPVKEETERNWMMIRFDKH